MREEPLAINALPAIKFGKPAIYFGIKVLHAEIARVEQAQVLTDNFARRLNST